MSSAVLAMTQKTGENQEKEGQLGSRWYLRGTFWPLDFWKLESRPILLQAAQREALTQEQSASLSARNMPRM